MELFSDPKRIFVTVVFVFMVISSGRTTRNDIHQMMYQTFENPVTCFRRFNGTHQFGCSTPRSGNFGVVVLIKTQSDLDWLLVQAAAGPYMVALQPEMFNSTVMNRFGEKNVSGVILLVNPYNQPEYFSPDDTCPNRYSSGVSSCLNNVSWNPNGNGFLLKDWPFPIFYVNNVDTIKAIEDCNRVNMPRDETQSSRALCSIRMKSHMFGAENSETCIGRSELINFNPLRYCDPMGDQNVFVSLGNVLKQNPQSTIVVAARLDAASLFEGKAPGAMTAVSGIATLLTAAHILYNMLVSKMFDKSIVFMLLNGEAFDYIGSSRVVYDIDKGRYPSTNFPIHIEQLSLFIDINQLDIDSDVYLHYYRKDAVSGNFSDLLKSMGTRSNLKFINVPTSTLPPSSVHSFLKVYPTLPSIIITNYKEQFANKFYNGIFDNDVNLKYNYSPGGTITKNMTQYKLANIANSMANTLYRMLTDDEAYNDILPLKLVDELLYCFLENSNCKLMQAVVSGEIESGSKPPLPLYVGVAQSPNRLTSLIGLILASLTSPIVNYTLKDCTSKQDLDKLYSLIWMNGNSGAGECINTTLKFTPAVSPAFQIKDYDWASGKYSTWTESVWQEISVVMFMKPSRYQEFITLGSGLGTMFLSFCIIYWISLHGQEMFLSQCPVNC